MKITVLLGGTSAERDVSIASGLRVAEALRASGHEVLAVDTARGALSPGEEQALIATPVVKREPPSQHELREMERETLPQMLRLLAGLQEADAVFLALHGGHGEDGTIQALLDLAGVTYTGSGHLGSGIAMDKDMSKRLFRQNDVPTADWKMVYATDDESKRTTIAQEALADIGLPLIVKPSKQGSTVGLSVVKVADQLMPAITTAFEYDDEVMIEQFIPGRELTVGILGDDALPVGEIIPKHEIYDYECKYTAGMADERFPADLTAREAARAQELAKRAFDALKLSGYARIDFRMTPDGELYCLEANTLPGMTQLSLIPQAAAAAGISFPQLCDRVVRLALERVAAARDKGEHA